MASTAGGEVGTSCSAVSSASIGVWFRAHTVEQFVCGRHCRRGNSAFAGGLVGTNAGAIAGIVSRELRIRAARRNSAVSGAVSLARTARAGGLVALNSGSITNAFATGTVTGAAGAGGITTLGGLAGTNQGLISGSLASGNVGSPLIANLQAGGLAGSNSGTIQSSSALGNVQAGDSGIAGGLVATNLGTITDSSATGAMSAAERSAWPAGWSEPIRERSRARQRVAP